MTILAPNPGEHHEKTANDLDDFYCTHCGIRMHGTFTELCNDCITPEQKLEREEKRKRESKRFRAYVDKL